MPCRWRKAMRSLASYARNAIDELQPDGRTFPSNRDNCGRSGFRVAPQLTVKGRSRAKFKELTDRPNVVSPTSGPGRRPVKPLPALLLAEAQTPVLRAEVVDTTRQVHASVEYIVLMRQPPTAARQGGHGCTV